MEFLFFKIKSCDAIRLSDEQFERVKKVHGLLIKLSYLDDRRYCSLRNFTKETKFDIPKIKKAFFKYILDEAENTVLSVNINDFDDILNDF